MPENHEIIKVATESVEKAISFDNEVTADLLRYSSWISALATGGIALLIVNFGKLYSYALIGKKWAFILLLIGAGLLFTSVLIGAWLHGTVNQISELRRQVITLYLRQYVEMQSVVSINDNPEQIRDKVLGGKYLSQAKRKDFDEISKQKNRVDRFPEVQLKAQQITAVLGYTSIFICAISQRVATPGLG